MELLIIPILAISIMLMVFPLWRIFSGLCINIASLIPILMAITPRLREEGIHIVGIIGLVIGSAIMYSGFTNIKN